MKKLFATTDSIPLLVTRMFLGVVFLPHGLQKTLGMFGGGGFSETMAFFTGGGTPAFIALLVIAGESLGSLGLITGFLTRLSGFGIVCIMTGAILMVHRQHGFFMNWFGNQEGEGFEYHLLAIGMGLALMIGGGGKWSLDGMIAKRR